MFSPWQEIEDASSGSSSLTERLLAAVERDENDFIRAAASRRPPLRPTLHSLRCRGHFDSMLSGLAGGADAHMLRMLFRWCEAHGIVMNPGMRVTRAADLTNFREHVFVMDSDVKKHALLLAVPEELCIGLKNADAPEELDNMKRGTAHGDAGVRATQNDDDDKDMCAFFFQALGVLVNDLLVAHGNTVSDPRNFLARALHRTRTAHNAPYLDAMSFGSTETCLAEVVLQMVHNFVQSGPLTGKVERDLLNWAVSVSMSHSTPLAIAGRRTIGIVPVLHLFRHGGVAMNAGIMARKTDADERRLQALFGATSPELTLDPQTRYVYVVAARDLAPGDEVCLQAMAPVCNRTEEADHMWRLTSGGPPPEPCMPSDEYQALQRLLREEVHRCAAAVP